MSIEIVLKENASAVIQVSGTFTDKDGVQQEIKGDKIALCRCGASKNKPFCDGSHMKAGFIAESGIIQLAD